MAAPGRKARRRKPRVYVVAGPNGAGKSTFAMTFLPEYAHCKEFVNADLIAAGLSPFAPESVAVAAGRLMLERIRTLASDGADFGFESTLSGRRHLRLLDELLRAGYSVHLLYLWLPSAELALSRVATRVAAGGHPVPEETVRRRYSRSIRNFLQVRSGLSCSWMLFDNSGDTPRLAARGMGAGEEILDSQILALVERSLV